MAEANISKWIVQTVEKIHAGEFAQDSDQSKSLSLSWSGREVIGLPDEWSNTPESQGSPDNRGGKLARKCGAAMRAAAPLLSSCQIVATDENKDFWEKYPSVPSVEVGTTPNWAASTFGYDNILWNSHAEADCVFELIPDGPYLVTRPIGPWMAESATRMAIAFTLLPELAKKLNSDALSSLLRHSEIRAFNSLPDLVSEAVAKNLTSGHLALLHNHEIMTPKNISVWKQAKDIAAFNGKKLLFSSWGELAHYPYNDKEIHILCGDFSNLICLLDKIVLSIQINSQHLRLTAQTKMLFADWQNGHSSIIAAKI